MQEQMDSLNRAAELMDSAGLEIMERYAPAFDNPRPGVLREWVVDEYAETLEFQATMNTNWTDQDARKECMDILNAWFEADDAGEHEVHPQFKSNN